MKNSSDEDEEEEDVEAILNGGPTPTATPTPPPPPLKEVNPRKRKDSENTASSKGSKAAANSKKKRRNKGGSEDSEEEEDEVEEKGGDGGRMEGSEAEDVKPTEDLMNDVNYYPVQEEHRPYIKVESLTKEYVAVLQTLQDRISNPQKGDKIDECVQIIMKTGCFSIANGAFTFDLCLLDKKTVKKMVDILKIDYEKYEK